MTVWADLPTVQQSLQLAWLRYLERFSAPLPLSTESIKSFMSLWNGTTVQDPHTSSIVDCAYDATRHFWYAIFCCGDFPCVTMPIIVHIKSSNKREHCFITWQLVVLCRLTFATRAPYLPFCTDNRGAICNFQPPVSLVSMQIHSFIQVKTEIISNVCIYLPIYSLSLSCIIAFFCFK